MFYSQVLSFPNDRASGMLQGTNSVFCLFVFLAARMMARNLCLKQRPALPRPTLRLAQSNTAESGTPPPWVKAASLSCYLSFHSLIRIGSQTWGRFGDRGSQLVHSTVFSQTTLQRAISSHYTRQHS